MGSFSSCFPFKKAASFSTTSVNEVVELEELEIPILSEECGDGDFWTAMIDVNGHITYFKLETGAAVFIVSDKEPWLNDQKLFNTN